MSYILDALRKSETERRQGQVPDLGQQVQLIHRPKPRSVPAATWVALALVANAAVLAYVFWPGQSAGLIASVQPASGERESVPAMVAAPRIEPAPSAEPSSLAAQSLPTTQSSPTNQSSSAPNTTAAASPPISSPVPALAPGGDVATAQRQDIAERPTVIVPSPRRLQPLADSPLSDRLDQGERVPHLVELPLSFQRQVPNLIFNSHIYSSDPSGRRVMINNHYLSMGDSFSGIRVERITEEGVELSLQGRSFRVGVVRDWISPR